MHLMRSMLLIFGLFICISATASPAVEKAWLVCEKDTDCTSIELGCYYWQPVNKKFFSQVNSRYLPACLKSTPSGPQPASSCKAGVCVNDVYTVRFWKLLGFPQKPQIVDERIKKCMDSAKVKIDWLRQSLRFVELREQLLRKVDSEIRRGAYDSNLPLEQVMEKSIDCTAVTNAFQEFKK